MENTGKPGAKIAIVTGGSRGLEANMMLSLARRGVHSIFTYHANRAEAGKVVAAVEAAGAKAIPIQLDAGKVGKICRVHTKRASGANEARR